MQSPIQQPSLSPLASRPSSGVPDPRRALTNLEPLPLPLRGSPEAPRRCMPRDGQPSRSARHPAPGRLHRGHGAGRCRDLGLPRPVVLHPAGAPSRDRDHPRLPHVADHRGLFSEHDHPLRQRPGALRPETVPEHDRAGDPVHHPRSPLRAIARPEAAATTPLLSTRASEQQHSLSRLEPLLAPATGRAPRSKSLPTPPAPDQGRRRRGAAGTTRENTSW
jgi:hypothetical protein